MRGRSAERGSALFVALVVIGLVSVWGISWIRSLGHLRRDADVRRAHEAGRDLAESAIARARVALARGEAAPREAWEGPGGSATVAVARSGDTVVLTGTATLEAGTREPPLRGVVVELTLRGGRVVGRAEHRLERPGTHE